MVAGLLFALLVAALMAGPSRPNASRVTARGDEVGHAKASPGVDEATARLTGGHEHRRAGER
jgi:hypothetical protein